MSPMILVFIAVAVFITVLGVAYGIQLFVNPERSAVDRLADLTDNNNDTGLLAGNEQLRSVTSNLGNLAAPDSEEEQNQLRLKLSQAGFRSRNNLETYSALRAGLAIALPLIVTPILGLESPLFIVLAVLVLATLGYYLPAGYIDNRLGARHKALLRPFPDALDLLVSSVEAGLGTDAAFQRVAKEIEPAAPELARELQTVNHEVSAGIPRVEALKRLDQRTGLAEVRSLVNVLTQAEKFGTSVASALRVHAELVRSKRMLKAEEEAAQISPKLTVAMILFILPALFTVLIGPAVINVVRDLLPAMAGN
ncbi:MAG: type II secretion system F family protein [Myxococcota bacterium]